MQWPVTLSDASSSRCDLETHLREGLAVSLVRNRVGLGGWQQRLQCHPLTNHCNYRRPDCHRPRSPSSVSSTVHKPQQKLCIWQASTQ